MADNFLKPVEDNGNVFEIEKTKTNTTLSGENLKFTKASRTDLTNRPYGNLFTSFNLPITDTQKALFESGGTYFNTAVSGINQNNIIIVEIPQNTYGELIDGKTIELNIPINTGGTDTVISIYSTYFSNSSENLTNGNTKETDSSTVAGLFGVTPSSSNDFNSNVSFLFSNQIKTPQYNTGTTWSQWSNTNKFSKNNPLGDTSAKQFAVLNPNDNLNNNTADEAIGVAYLDKGFFVITNPTIVNNFSYSGATSSGYDDVPSGSTYTGGTDFTQIYFTSSTSANTSFSSIKNEFIQNVTAFAMVNEFYESTNPTFLEVYEDGNPDNEPVYVTEIGLYNENKELIAIGKLSEPIPKNKFNIITFNVKLKV